MILWKIVSFEIKLLYINTTTSEEGKLHKIYNIFTNWYTDAINYI